MATAYLERMGERIRTRREALGLSRADVARAMPGKTNENQVYRWEKGRHRPGPDALEALALALSIPVSYFLMDDVDTPTPTPFSDADRLARVERKLDLLMDLASALAAQAGLDNAEEFARAIEEVAAAPDEAPVLLAVPHHATAGRDRKRGTPAR